ncbi:MAG: sulfatase-like hydrolase/transferase [Spirochaetes bacterium]|nr:sulfatase-like hydrolase/transferase [Spirochaetota bacterium]
MDDGTPASKKNTTTIFLSVSLFVLSLFLFTPARISIGNFMEFTFPFHESMLCFLAVSLVLILIFFAAVLLVSRHQKTCRIIVSMLTVSAFLLWLQGNILVWQYGVLDGKDIEWDTFINYGIIDSVLWTALIAFAIFKADLVFRISRFMSIVLIIVQLISVSVLWFSMPKDQSFKRQESNTDTLHLYSEHINVIVLVLDTFQSDIFQDIVMENTDLEASFDGFTYFRNSLAGSDGTVVSIPNMLTANNYDNSVPFLDFVKTSFLENSLPKTLKEYSFSVDLLPMLKPSVYTDFSGIAPLGKKLRDWNAFFEEQAYIADLSLFRSLPQFMKKWVYNHQRWFISGLAEQYLYAESSDGTLQNGEQETSGSYNLKYSRELENSKKLLPKHWDARFLNTMVSMSGIIENTDVFKFIHLNGIHLQLRMNEDLLYEVLDPTRANMKRQGTGVLKMAAIFLERLKQMGVYNNSLIFIVGDHGSGVAGATINISPYGDNFNKSGPYQGNFKTFKAAGIPLILVKRMNATGELRTSDAPVSLLDIPQTVVEELGLDAEFPGKSMFLVEENEERERIYRAFVGPQEDVDYLAPIIEYSVNGFSWDDTSWRETGNIYYANPK